MSYEIPYIITTGGKDYRLIDPKSVADINKHTQVLKHPKTLPERRQWRIWPWSKPIIVHVQRPAEELVKIGAGNVATVITDQATIGPWELEQNYWWV